MYNTYQRAIEDSQTQRIPPYLCHVERFVIVKKCAISTSRIDTRLEDTDTVHLSQE